MSTPHSPIAAGNKGRRCQRHNLHPGTHKRSVRRQDLGLIFGRDLVALILLIITTLPHTKYMNYKVFTTLSFATSRPTAANNPFAFSVEARSFCDIDANSFPSSVTTTVGASSSAIIAALRCVTSPNG